MSDATKAPEAAAATAPLPGKVPTHRLTSMLKALDKTVSGAFGTLVDDRSADIARLHKMYFRTSSSVAKVKYFELMLECAAELEGGRDPAHAAFLAALQSTLDADEAELAAGAANKAGIARRCINGLAVVHQRPVEAVGTGPALLTASEGRALLEARSPRDLLRRLTPRLSDVTLPRSDPEDPCPLVLVNCERQPWLPQSSRISERGLWPQPHLLLSWAPCVELRREGGAGQGSSAADSRFRFGCLGGTALLLAGCAAGLFLATTRAVDDAALGELAALHSSTSLDCRGVVFGPESFWM
jgi:hypothetical protein